MIAFRIPEISCPFQSSLNPCIQQVRSRMQEWLQRSHLVQDEAALQHYLERVDVPSFACRFHSKATLEDMLLCSDWYSWAFVLDDLSDDGSLARQPEAMRLFHEHLLDVFHHPSLVSPQGPIAHSLLDFWQRLRQRTSAVWQKRFVQHHADYFAGQEQEAEHRRHNHAYDVSTYIENRRNSIGAYMCFDLLEVTQLVDISTEVYESQPSFRRSSLICALCSLPLTLLQIFPPPRNHWYSRSLISGSDLLHRCRFSGKSVSLVM